MADLVGAVAALLTADAGVAAIASDRVFGGELSPEETAQMPRGAVVVAPSGGASLTAGSYAEADTARVDITSYGSTRREAEQLRDAVATVMRRVRRSVFGGVLIHWAQSAGGPVGGRDPNFAWPQAMQPFQIFHSLQEV